MTTTIDESIRVLKIMVEDCDRLNEPHSKDCLLLAIEALKRIKETRHDPLAHLVRYLPGETEE